MKQVVVREMTPTEFAVYRRSSVEKYAAQHVRAADWAAEDALELAERETDELLPSGVRTPGMVLLVGESAGAVTVMGARCWKRPSRPSWTGEAICSV